MIAADSSGGEAEAARRVLHQLAQPLAAAALALDVALLAESRGDQNEIRIRLQDAVDAVDRAMAIMRNRKDF